MAILLSGRMGVRRGRQEFQAGGGAALSSCLRGALRQIHTLLVRKGATHCSDPDRQPRTWGRRRDAVGMSGLIPMDERFIEAQMVDTQYLIA
jgi:hypothetical protein